MKVIDLLNKIANGEEVPKYVQYYNMLQDKLDTMMVCKENIYYKLDNLEIQINSRVKPIEEKKIPKKLELPDKFEIGGCNVRIGSLGFVPTESIVIDGILSKINSIIDYLKSKGDE